MKKYNIEGNIDFFSELYKSLDDTDSSESNNNYCLITNQELTDKFVELTCGHKFNYIPLYNDIYNHKKKFNNMEGAVSLLKLNEIRCPYCRKKQIGVLPYYEELIKEKTNGVNFYDDTQPQNTGYVSIKPLYHFGKCEFIMSPLIINDMSMTPSLCKTTYVTKFECDNKTYCWTHTRIMNKKLEKEKKDKEKEAQKKLKKEAKDKEKEEKKSAKEDLKKSSKKSNDLILSITNIEGENIVVNSSSQTQIEPNNEGCIQIIKTGINKGNPCGLAILNDCLCKRHYNLKTKTVII
jgi:hypothetical protein